MAEAMLKKIIEQEKISNVEVCSSGIYAETGDVSTVDAIETMQEYNINLKEHRATNTKESPIETMDLILCATLSHKRSVLQMYPELTGKVFTMKEYVSKIDCTDLDIKDPWGYDVEIYRFCAAEIEDCIDKLLIKLK